MEETIYFRRELGRHLRLIRIALILILFAAIAQFASFGLIQAHVSAFYGAQQEDISFALQISYAGIITTLPIQFRLVKYFNTRSYLLTAFMLGVMLNIGCLFVDDLILFCALRFLIGVITCLVAGCMLIVLFSTLPENKSMIVGISLFFCLVLTAGLFVGLGASWVVSQTDWTSLYYGLTGLQLIAMLLCLLIFKSKPAVKPYPLYQIDWTGAALFMFAATATSFVLIYGPKRYWLEDATIKYVTAFGIAMLVLFLLRQSTLKRPLIHLSAFRSGKFVFALILMLLFFGVRDSINFLYGYSAGVLGWSSWDVASAGMYNIIGVVLATLIVIKVILSKKENLPILLLAGFSLMVLYHSWVYLYLTPDLSFNQLIIPVFIQGFASGLLLVPITIFCIASLPQSTGMTGIVICTYARFIAVHNSTAGFYTLQLYYNQHYRQGFLTQLVPESNLLSPRRDLYRNLLQTKGYNQNEAASISDALIAKASAIQSQLLTIRAIFLIGALLMATALVMLLIFAIITRVKTFKATRVASNATSLQTAI